MKKGIVGYYSSQSVRLFFDMDDNTRQALETTEHYETSGKPGLVFRIDFEKSFDKAFVYL
jgi:hypothetical protein